MQEYYEQKKEEKRGIGGGVSTPLTNVTGSRKRGHFAQEFKIELLVLKGRVALKQ